MKNKNPIIIASAVAVAAGILSLTITFAVRGAPKPEPVPTPEPVVTDLLERYKRCKEQGRDPVNEFKLFELANISMLKFKQNTDYLTISHGQTASMGGAVKVDVSVATILKEGKAFEESISFSDFIFAPKVGNRDYEANVKEIELQDINQYSGTAKNVSTVKWNNDPIKTYDKGSHFDAAGKDVSNPFFYTISEQTVLTEKDPEVDPRDKSKVYNDSKIIKNDDGSYVIDLKLRCTDFTKENAIEHYAKRITYLSNDTKLTDFYFLNYKMYVDNDFNLIKTVSHEEYKVLQMTIIKADTVGELTTKFYSSNIPDIPTLEENFNYSDYPF